MRVFLVNIREDIVSIVRTVVEQDRSIEIVGLGMLNLEVVSQIRTKKPDLLLINPSPIEEHIGLLAYFKQMRIPSVLISPDEADITGHLVYILELGAVGLVPINEGGDVKTAIRREFELNRPRTSSAPVRAGIHAYPQKIVAIGSSTGGPEALVTLLSRISPNFSYPIVIVQHMPEDFTKRFAARLDTHCPLLVKEAQEGDLVDRGLVLLAPGGKHMEIHPVSTGYGTRGKVAFNMDPPVWGLRPTVDKMMKSVAPIWQHATVGVILTGMGDDGLLGMRAIKEYGGKTIVQNKETSVVYGMAQQVSKHKLADYELPLEEIAVKIEELVG